MTLAALFSFLKESLPILDFISRAADAVQKVRDKKKTGLASQPHNISNQHVNIGGIYIFGPTVHINLYHPTVSATTAVTASTSGTTNFDQTVPTILASQLPAVPGLSINEVRRPSATTVTAPLNPST